jgi:hypothetical protein
MLKIRSSSKKVSPPTKKALNRWYKYKDSPENDYQRVVFFTSESQGYALDSMEKGIQDDWVDLNDPKADLWELVTEFEVSVE